MLVGAWIRHFFNLRHAGRTVWWIPVTAAAALAAIAVWIRPPDAGSSTNGPPVTFAEVAPIVEQRCASCHSGAAAPKGVRLENARADRRASRRHRARRRPHARDAARQQHGDDGRRARAARTMDRLPAVVDASGRSASGARAVGDRRARRRKLREGNGRRALRSGSHGDRRALMAAATARGSKTGPAMRPLHVSAGVRDDRRTSWRRHRRAQRGWWLGLPQLEPARYAWATDDARTRLGRRSVAPPASGPPELEDFFEFSMKVRRAARQPTIGSGSASTRRARPSSRHGCCYPSTPQCSSAADARRPRLRWRLPSRPSTTQRIFASASALPRRTMQRSVPPRCDWPASSSPSSGSTSQTSTHCRTSYAP